MSVKNFLFLIASGITTGLSWLFYFKAIQLGDISKVAPIDKLSLVLTIILGVVILKETLTFPVIVGGMLIIIGVLVLFFLA
ncbi:MAG: EamA family transporter [Candidatus Gastranaerophilaceae bacterium]